MNKSEVWKTYPEFDFIQGSNLGRVKTVDRVVKTKNGMRLIKGHILKQQLDRYGYWFVRADSSAVEKTKAKFGDEVARKVEQLMSEKDYN